MAVLENLEKMTRDGVTLSAETIAALNRREARQGWWRTLGIWIIALTFIGILLALHQM